MGVNKRALAVLLVLALLFAVAPMNAQSADGNTGSETALRDAVMENGTGDVILGANIGTLSTRLTIARSLTLDLNGYSLDINLGGLFTTATNGIRISPGVTLTIIDSSGGGSLRVRSTASAVFSRFVAINASDGALVIRGGTVRATGINGGAGIDGSGGAITISGGTVTATSASGITGIGGAGIGVSEGTITISGGTVTATGASGGAGIGGSGGTISISGGTVAATGASNSAGIGGVGIGGSGATISISGGTVTAIAGDTGAAIGRGDSGAAGTVSITGTYDYWTNTANSAPAQKRGTSTFDLSINTFPYSNTYRYIKLESVDVKYTVTFVDWDETTVLMAQEVEPCGRAIRPTDPDNRPGWHFVGWDRNIDYVFEGMTVKALYEINKYTVKFIDHDGAVIKTQDIEHGSYASAPAPPTRACHSFTKWDVDFNIITSPLEVTALYEVVEPMHNEEHAVVTKTPPTCVDEGLVEYCCPLCEKMLRTETIAATGHAWGNAVETIAATASSAGERTYTCTVCGFTRTESIPPTGGGNFGGGNPGGGSSESPGTDITEPDPGEVEVSVPITPLAPGLDLPFTDVLETHWFYRDVYYMWEHNLMNGTSDTLFMMFSPFEPLTRGMVVTVMYRIEKEPSVSALVMPFTDVGVIWYYDAIKWAADKGIALGFDDGTFHPDENVTREQMAAFISRYANYTGAEIPVSIEYAGFADQATISDWAVDAVRALYRAEIIRGKEDNRFDPRGYANRAEFAAVLHRFLTESQPDFGNG